MILKCRVKCLLPPFLFLPTLYRKGTGPKKARADQWEILTCPSPFETKTPDRNPSCWMPSPALLNPHPPTTSNLTWNDSGGGKKTKKKKEKDQDNLFVPYPNHHWTSWCHGRLIASTVLKWNRIINVSSHKQLKAHSFCFVLEVSCDKFPMAAFSQVNCLVFL